MIFITPRLINEGEIALSNRHELIDEVEEVEKLRDVATLFDVRHKYEQKIDSNDQNIQCLTETMDLLEAQDQPYATLHKTDSVALTYPDNIIQERETLQEVIALLDVKNEQMRPVIAEQKKNYKYKASSGVVGK